MINFLLALGVFLSLTVLLLGSVIAGRYVGKWQIAHDADHKLGVVSVAEGAVFALLGLLVAFTFTGAYERFEARKIHIIEEANAIETAYLRLDLLPTASRDTLRDLLRQYLDSRLTLYAKMTDFNMTKTSIHHSRELQHKVWDAAVAACNAHNDGSITQLIIIALNNMFDVANTRLAITKVHPPLAIFELLIGLGILSAFLAGYSTAKTKFRNSIHILSYILITAFTLYLIIDLEVPRVGLIRVDAFDKILTDVKENL